MPRGRKPAPKPSDLSIVELRALLDQKLTDAAKQLPGLKKRQTALLSELETLEAEIGEIEGTTPTAAKKRGRKPESKKRGRPAAAKAAKPKGRRNGSGGKVTIPMAITQVLSEAGKPMKAAEIKAMIWEKGLLSKYSKSFGQQVAIALSRGFKKVERGIYTI